MKSLWAVSYTHLDVYKRQGIYESQTNTLLEAGDGQLLRTEVKSIKEGAAGNPGEIRGIFYRDSKPIGNVKKNSQFGIYASGIDFSGMENAQPVVMAYQDQIKEGPAYILTTINGNQVEKFDVNIVKVNRQKMCIRDSSRLYPAI